MEKPYHIYFVCTGNACRSPLAECILKQLLKQTGLTINVSSAGTLNWGSNPRDPIMTEIAGEMDYQLTGRTQAITYPMLKDADLIIVFDRIQKDLVTQYVPYAHWDRITLFNQIAFGKADNLQDPRLQSVDVYRKVATAIEQGCIILVEKWQANPPYSI